MISYSFKTGLTRVFSLYLNFNKKCLDNMLTVFGRLGKMLSTFRARITKYVAQLLKFSTFQCKRNKIFS